VSEAGGRNHRDGQTPPACSPWSNRWAQIARRRRSFTIFFLKNTTSKNAFWISGTEMRNPDISTTRRDIIKLICFTKSLLNFDRLFIFMIFHGVFRGKRALSKVVPYFCTPRVLISLKIPGKAYLTKRLLDQSSLFGRISCQILGLLKKIGRRIR
jgi:hypothetical protein